MYVCVFVCACVRVCVCVCECMCVWLSVSMSENGSLAEWMHRILCDFRRIIAYDIGSDPFEISDHESNVKVTVMMFNHFIIFLSYICSSSCIIKLNGLYIIVLIILPICFYGSWKLKVWRTRNVKYNYTPDIITLEFQNNYSIILRSSVSFLIVTYSFLSFNYLCIFTPPRNRGGVIFSLQFVCVCVCVSVCVSTAILWT